MRAAAPRRWSCWPSSASRRGATRSRARSPTASSACWNSRARSRPSRRLLLIDEPAAGLNASEVDSLLDRILTTRRKGVTVVVVEHNMELVMNVADRVLVMDYGQHLFEGVPADVQKNAAVVSAYLGGELM